MIDVDYVVMFSGGKGSWGAARYLLDEQGVAPDRMALLFTDTNGEDPDLYRFLHEAADNLGAHLYALDNGGATIWDVFRKERMIGNTRLSVCSRALKQAPARAWLAENIDPATTRIVVGIDWTESHRLPAIVRNYAPWQALAPLAEPGAWSRDRINAELTAAGVAEPRLYALGFAHNNCAGACVRGGQGQWAMLLKHNPDRYAEEERAENAFRADIGKDVAILRDRSWAARLAALGLAADDVERDEPEDGVAGPWRHRETGAVVEVPTLVPLTLTALRRRVEGAGSVDHDDIGGCGCMTDLDMDGGE